MQQTDRDILGSLRSETSEAHKQLDEYLDLMGAVGRERYTATLASFRDAHTLVDTALRPHEAELAALGYDLGERDKLPLIDADLEFLGHRHVPVTPADSFVAPTLADAIGVVYVVEGATLGGQVIHRHIVPELGLTPPDGCRYFGGYGALTGQRWRETQKVLTAFADRSDDPDAISRAVDAASRTFRLFHELARARLG